MKRVVVALLSLMALSGCQAPGQFEGAAQIVQMGRIKADGQYDRGQKNGVWTYYDAQGRVQGQGTYAHGKMVEGLEITFHGNGQKAAEGTWAAGQKDGHWIEYYRNGKKKLEGLYLHGQKTGVWKEYDPSNYYITEKVWENDKLVGWRGLKHGRIGNPFSG